MLPDTITTTTQGEEHVSIEELPNSENAGMEEHGIEERVEDNEDIHMDIHFFLPHSKNGWAPNRTLWY